jgi:3-oxoacyl-[acyl-carrier-protein] synthase I
VIVVGADSYCDRRTIQALDEAGDLKSEVNRNGFHPGEAAAAVLITSDRMARAMGLKRIARLTAVSCAVERVDPDGDEVLNGEGLSAAISGLEAVVRETGVKITDTYCDLNGVRYRNDELMFTVLRTQHLFEDAHSYLHPADCWGDVGAASGPLFAVLAAEANRKGYAAGSRALLWASSHSGSRAAALLDFPAGTTS